MDKKQTAAQAGWKPSRYSICAAAEKQDAFILANLFAGTMGRYSPSEVEMLGRLEALPEDHPLVKRFADNGLIVRFDERDRLQAMSRRDAEAAPVIRMTICPTMACNFDCPYCFQKHRTGKMTEQVQDQVAALADRLFAASGAEELAILWYGGEPLLAPEVMERLTRLLNHVCTKYSAGLRARIVTNGYLMDGETARLLSRLRVKHARITLDGTGDTHNATRHLAGGGGTFDRILENLSRPLPFSVEVRFNVHAGNRPEADMLRERMERIAAESGNRIIFREAEVFETDLSLARSDAPELLSADEVKEISLQRENLSFRGARGRRCAAQKPYNVCIDECGRLYACSAVLAEPEHAFGNAADWDPADPDTTADAPKERKWFLEDSLPRNDPECMDCLWLPVCGGGCAHLRRKGRRDCVPWKDDPEGFVLAQYRRKGEKQRDSRLTPALVGETAAPILKKWGVRRAWVYGSVALGRAQTGSDVDMIVEMPQGEYLGFGIVDLRYALSQALGRKVDLHTPPNEGSTRSVARIIERTKVLVYDSGKQNGNTEPQTDTGV